MAILSLARFQLDETYFVVTIGMQYFRFIQIFKDFYRFLGTQGPNKKSVKIPITD